MVTLYDNDLSQMVLKTAGLTKKELLERYDQMAQETITERTMYWDIDDLVRETRYSKASLEKYITCDPRMKVHQRQLGPRFKRVWLSEPTAIVLEEILNNQFA
ncbi:hypothetical protein [Lysinibacillus sp. NPDC047702]|uniref:hypothetical protein n=1 Tax=unclassified Lysinibacillus TaxID=2636778 RepID=UPI003D00F2D4